MLPCKIVLSHRPVWTVHQALVMLGILIVLQKIKGDASDSFLMSLAKAGVREAICVPGLPSSATLGARCKLSAAPVVNFYAMRLLHVGKRESG